MNQQITSIRNTNKFVNLPTNGAFPPPPSFGYTTVDGLYSEKIIMTHGGLLEITARYMNTNYALTIIKICLMLLFS